MFRISDNLSELSSVASTELRSASVVIYNSSEPGSVVSTELKFCFVVNYFGIIWILDLGIIPQGMFFSKKAVIYVGTVIVGTVFFFLLPFWKYFNFGYNALDLAIFNQVFWNTSFGRFFQFSIHPQSYLGDHFIPFIILLAPFYALFRSPLTLLFFQSLVLSLSVWPLYLITQKFFKNMPRRRLWGWGVVLFFLFNPFLWNINLFEFHIVSFLPFLFFWSFYFWQKRKFFLYLLFIFLILSLREDMAFLVFMFSFLPFLKQGERGGSVYCWKVIFKKNLKWIIFPLFLSIFWFLGSTRIISYFNPDNSYKFLAYYQWLGEAHSFGGLIGNALGHPLLVLEKLFSFKNILITAVLFIPFLFLPWWGKRYLFLGLIFYLEFALNSQGLSEITYSTHYIAFFLPVLVVSSLEGIKNIYFSFSARQTNFLIKKLIKEKELLVSLITVAFVYNFVVFGPAAYFLPFFSNLPLKDSFQTEKLSLLKSIPSQASVVSSYGYLPYLSSRSRVYSLHYGFLGHRQLSPALYSFPSKIDYYVIDFADLSFYELQFREHPFYKDYFQNGFSRLKEYLRNYKIEKAVGGTIIFKQGGTSQLEEKISNLSVPYLSPWQVFGGKLALLNVEKKEGYYVFCWQALQNLDRNYFLKLEVKNKKGKVLWKKYYPLAYFSPSSFWQKGDIYKVRYWWDFSSAQFKESKVNLEVVSLEKGYLTLDSLRRAVLAVEKESVLGKIDSYWLNP